VTRIVGGLAGGRRLAVPAGRTVRPTSERVREALASALDARLGGLTGRSVLDLYAGTGAVGLELLSRGAAAVTLVETDAAVLAGLRANVAAVGLPGAQVIGGRAESVAGRLTASHARFDIVFLDPPYAHDIDPVMPIAAALASAVLIVERATRSGPPAWPGGLSAAQTRRYGDSTLWYGWRS
jgi:16S rRNA (guanine966-N2)-methyltransferase